MLSGHNFLWIKLKCISVISSEKYAYNNLIKFVPWITGYDSSKISRQILLVNCFLSCPRFLTIYFGIAVCRFPSNNESFRKKSKYFNYRRENKSMQYISYHKSDSNRQQIVTLVFVPRKSFEEFASSKEI